MRIERLTFERYGIFSDRTLSFHPDAALHVVHGANEAGKTSALSAISDLMFGFGGRTPYDFKHDGKTLRIGGSFLHSDGRVITARRRKGNKNTLVDEADQPLPDDRLAPLLDGVSQEIFIREFGLTARALRDGGHELLNAGGRLAETLAASSAGMTALSRIKERLQSEADELFTTRRSGSKAFYLATDRRDIADKKLRDSIVSREALQQSESAVQDARANMERLTREHAQSGSALERWRRTLRVRSKLARLERLGSEQAVFTDLPAVPKQSLAEWQVALDTDTALGREISALDAADSADIAEISAMAVNEMMVSEGYIIDALRERLGAIRKAIDDLPRRRQARDGAAATLDDAARRLGLRGHEALLERLPTDLALAQARDLLDRTGRLEQTVADADVRRARATQELQDIVTGESGDRAIVASEHLLQRFDALGDIPGQADRLRRDTAAMNVETVAIVALAASLDPRLGELEEIRALPVPDEAVIAKYASAFELHESEEKRLRDAVGATNEAIAATEAELARLSGTGPVPTRADLTGARRERDGHLDGLRAGLDGDRATTAALLKEVVRSNQTIDSITDLLLIDAERATLQEDAQQRLAASRAESKRIAETLAKLRTRMAEVSAAWIEQWAASGVTPRNPAEMLRWRERLDDILNRLDKRDGQKANIDALSATLDASKVAIMAFLNHVGRTPDHTLPPDILFREAKARLGELQKAWANVKAQLVAKQRIERDLNEAEAGRAAAQRGLADLHQAWPSAMAGIGLTGKMTTAQAEAALTVWHCVGIPKASLERENRSIETMEADLQVFDRDVFDAADRIAPELKSETAKDTLARLSAALAEMRSATESCRRLREACEQRAASRKALGLQRSSAALILDEARRILGIACDVDLPETIARVSARQQLECERVGLRRDILEIGDGRDEEALRQEQVGINFDQLPGEIARETVRQKQLLEDIAVASALSHQRVVELNTLLKGRDAGAAAAERAEAGAELLSITERWLLRSAASRLATRAIERHRAMVQDPLIAHASVLFAMATGHAFAGLGIDYGEDDQPILVMRRNNDEHVQVGGLSEGTRDQLFLALRLALLERLTSEPLPFIGDDLLTSFDEERTAAALRLFAAAGKQRQIILFTHHRHVVDLARNMQDHLIDFINL